MALSETEQKEVELSAAVMAAVKVALEHDRKAHKVNPTMLALVFTVVITVGGWIYGVGSINATISTLKASVGALSSTVDDLKTTVGVLKDRSDREENK